jgi:hypothetical protein
MDLLAGFAGASIKKLLLLLYLLSFSISNQGSSREANYISASSLSFPVAGVRQHEQSLLRHEAGAGRRDAIRPVRAAAAEVQSTSEAHLVTDPST